MTFKENGISILLGALICIGLIVAPAISQTPVARPQVAQPSDQQKKALKEAADTYRTAQQQADAARDKFTIQLLNVMAELGLKPSETNLTWDSAGFPIFTKAEPIVAKDGEKKKEDAKKTP